MRAPTWALPGCAFAGAGTSHMRQTRWCKRTGRTPAGQGVACKDSQHQGRKPGRGRKPGVPFVRAEASACMLQQCASRKEVGRTRRGRGSPGGARIAGSMHPGRRSSLSDLPTSSILPRAQASVSWPNRSAALL
eukprot:364522-Chlamydomonas_euryale.AAC.13